MNSSPIDEIVTFDPMWPPNRKDVDLRKWYRRVLPKTQTKPDSVWSSMSSDIQLPCSEVSIPSEERVGHSMSIARRNALELAQQLRRPDECACTMWPQCADILYLPVPCNRDADTQLHMEGAFCSNSAAGVHQIVKRITGCADVHVPMESDNMPLSIDANEDGSMDVRRKVFLDHFSGMDLVADAIQPAAGNSNGGASAPIAGVGSSTRPASREARVTPGPPAESVQPGSSTASEAEVLPFSDFCPSVGAQCAKKDASAYARHTPTPPALPYCHTDSRTPIHTQTDRQTDRQTYIQTDRQTDRQTD